MVGCRKGFTLIELLVVIAIIAVLAAILFPILTYAKESGKKTTCLVHGREISDALYAYLGDWNDTFPKQPYIDNYYGPGPVGGSNPEDLMGWDMRILFEPYCKNKAMWNCKSFYGQWGRRYSWSWDTGTGYTSWIYMGGGPNALDNVTLEAQPLSTITRPSRKAAFYDWFAQVGPKENYIPHLGGTILIYADGHVRWHKIRVYPSLLLVEGYKYPP